MERVVKHEHSQDQPLYQTVGVSLPFFTPPFVQKPDGQGRDRDIRKRDQGALVSAAAGCTIHH